MPTYIYTLIDPRTNQVRYVGKSDRPERRVRDHLCDARRGVTDHKSRWLALLLREGLRPEVHILETCAVEIWKERERYWIDYYRSRCDLTNSQDGGDGGNLSEEARRKMSEAKKGRPNPFKGIPRPAEVREKIARALTGRKFPPRSAETRRKQSEALKGRRLSDECRAKLSAAHKGKKVSDEARANMSAAQKRRGPRSEETREKIRRALTGRVVSEETRAKLRGRTVSDETRQRMRASHKGTLGKPCSEETKEKIRRARLRYWDEVRQRGSSK